MFGFVVSLLAAFHIYKLDVITRDRDSIGKEEDDVVVDSANRAPKHFNYIADTLRSCRVTSSACVDRLKCFHITH